MGNVATVVLSGWRQALLVLAVMLVSVAGHAQALGTIAGSAKDASGGVLPGVTVEVSSQALIEKIRTASTDGSGQYRIINLPPGTYTVTFTLPGFATVKREGVGVSTNFTASINADMRVGGLEETITVTGETPIVDVQSATLTRTATAQVFKEIPSSGSWTSMAAVMSAVRTSSTDVGGVLGDPTGATISAHGSRDQDAVSLFDGMRIGNMYQSSNNTNMSLSPLLFDQVDIQMSGQTGETGTNGVVLNAVPRSGGNRFSGSALVNGSRPGLQGSNLTDRLKARGLTGATTTLKTLHDFNGAVGGPIKRDKVWFYATSRYFTNEFNIAGNYFAVDPTAVRRQDDLGKPASGGTYTYDNNARVTWAINDKQKFQGWYAFQYKVDPRWAIGATLSPEAVRITTWHTQLSTFKWTYTATNRLLFEAGAAPGGSPDTILAPADRINGISITEQGSAVGSAVGARPVTYRAPTGFDFRDRLPSQSFTGAMSYVTGTHSFKIGSELQRGHFIRGDNNDSTGGIWYRTRDYVPNLVTIQAPNAGWRNNLDYNLGIYAQDRWTADRLTLNGGVRLDVQKESVSAFTSQPHRWLPNRNTSFPSAEVTNWKDVNPRVSAAYDLFGTGKTALKASASRGVEQDSIRYASANNPAATLVTSVPRVWTDTNSNFVPDCDLFNSQPNGECGVWQDLGFGTARPTTFYDPAILTGWGTRPWNWEFSAGVQHELLPRLSVSAGYFRRVLGNFNVQDNEALTPADFTQYSVTAPTDSRLPNSGQTISGIYDQNRAVVNRQVIKSASNFGNQYWHWNGFDVNVDARLANGLFLQGGFGTGKTFSDNCDIIDDVPEALTIAVPTGVQPTLGTVGALMPAGFCRHESPFLTNFKGLASYSLPYGVRVAGTWQSLTGPQIAANQIYANVGTTVPNTTLSRPLTFAQSTVNVIEPGSMYGDRLNQIDVRFTKVVAVGVGRVDLNVDIYNALNSDAILAQQNAYGAVWTRPLSVIQPRFLKFSARWDF
jgi:hypothetical protein